MTPADYDRLLTVIRALLDRQAQVIAAIDGRCGAGKSTLAAQLQAQLSCRVFHMDDFFLRPEQRTAARLAQPKTWTTSAFYRKCCSRHCAVRRSPTTPSAVRGRRWTSR